jgi:lambda family phage portal protein
MNLFDRLIGAVDPVRALRRAQARQALAHYDAGTVGRRVAGVRHSAADADTAAARRARIAYFGRDLIRNTPFATSAQQVIVNATVGDGIIPQFRWPDGTPQAAHDAGVRLIEEWLDSTQIDAAGRLNLYGLQSLVMGSVVSDGEVLVVEEWGAPQRDGLPALKLRVLEIDHLDEGRDGGLDGGGWIRNGIEYDSSGRRVAYWLFDEHPGAGGYRPGSGGWRGTSHRVAAHLVHHVYRLDRPEQERGVSWFAPVALTLLDYGDFQDAQAMRQKIAACFTAFRIHPEGTPRPEVAAEASQELEPGLIQDLYGEQEIQFANPPGVEGYDEYTRNTLRAAAAALGITYEALTGDLSNVNFSSARMGHQKMERNVSAWQWKMLIPQLLQPLGRSIREAWAQALPEAAALIRQARIEWTPPARFLVDPEREFAAMRDAVRAGFVSRSQIVRSLGYDPERLLEEQRQDAEAARRAGLVFDSDAAVAMAGAATQPQITTQEIDDG